LVEKHALEAATFSNYRPATAELWRWLRVRVSAWLIWRCVQFHGAKLCEQLERQWWPDRAEPKSAAVVVTEMDSTYLKHQQRGSTAGVPVSHFPMHLGMHYSGRERRYHKRGSSSVRLANKRWILSSERLAIFGRRLAWQRMRHFARRALHIILSDADEGLKWVREREFAYVPWLLDRWHIAQNVRTLVCADQVEHRRIMAAVWKSTVKRSWKCCAPAPIAKVARWNLTLSLATS
jgi:hypothetical protein